MLVSGCGYHLGSPPVAAGGFEVAAIRAPVAEPGAGDALRAGLVEALSVRSALGSLHTVEARIIDLSETTVAADEDEHVHRVGLTIELEVPDTGQRTLLHGERAYAISPVDPLGASGARAEAVASLARELAVDGVEWLLKAPAAKGTP